MSKKSPTLCQPTLIQGAYRNTKLFKQIVRDLKLKKTISFKMTAEIKMVFWTLKIDIKY
jgi:hypothetical protein